MEVLPPPLRVVVLGLLDGQTPAEIAASLHLSPVTIRTRLLRARVLLRHELWPLLGEPAMDKGSNRPSPRHTERRCARLHTHRTLPPPCEEA
jgi:hypothetical protein